MKKIIIQLDELVCPMCATKIETALKKLKGIDEVSVLYNASKAKVTFDESILNIETITNTITNIGYDVLNVK